MYLLGTIKQKHHYNHFRHDKTAVSVVTKKQK